jgi:predicted SprT family Zn-dependent metalloprotease
MKLSLFKKNKSKKPNTFLNDIWLPSRYICKKKSCKGDLHKKTELHEKIVAYGGRYISGSSIPMNPITQPFYVDTNTYKCHLCGRVYHTTLFIKQRPLTDRELEFKEFVKNIGKSKTATI